MLEKIKYIYRYFRRLVCKRILNIRVKTIKDRIRKSKKPIKVAFMVQYPEMWNSEKSVYESMLHDSRFEVSIICIPKDTGLKNHQLHFENTNIAFEFLSKFYDNCINAKENGTWYDIAKDKPDYLFLQRPYDFNMPDCYSQYALSNNSLLCYIPYGFEFVNGIHLDIEYNEHALNNIYLIFAENTETLKYIETNSTYELKKSSRKILDIGYPRFDMLESARRNRDTISTFLWVPRWSTEDVNDSSHFLDFFDNLIEYFKKISGVNLIIRPHPLMFKNFIQKGILSETDVQKIKDTVELIPNISFDNNLDYIETFKSADALIADFTSLLIEFFLLDKPIIYCGETNCFNSVGKTMDRGLYHATNWKDLKHEIELILHGNDSLRDARSWIVNSYFEKNGERVGDKIAAEILRDSGR